MSSDNGKQSVTENFCDKISRSIWTQIKENGNIWERNTIWYTSLHVLCGMNLFKLRNNGIRFFLKRWNKFKNSKKITSSQMFFNYMKSIFAFLFRIGCHVNRLLGWKPTIAAWLFIHHLKRCPVDSLQSWFDTKLCRIDFRCVSKSTSICVETTLFRK